MEPPVKTRAIGMDEDSGHKVCGYKLLFATLLWSAFSGQIGLPIVAGIMVNTFRADGNLFGTLQLVAGFLALLFAAFAGYFQDSGCCQSVFEKAKCPRKTWGRRAPHMLVYIPLMSLPLLLVWLPPNWANMALKVDDTAKLSPSNFTLDNKNGLVCSSPIVVAGESLYFFNETIALSGDREVHGAKEIIGICEGLVSEQSFCWPFKDAVRKCAYSDPGIAVHWFLCFVVGMWCFENINASYISGSIEIYPWKEERLQLTSLGVVVAILGVSVPVITSGIVQNSSEFGTNPSGDGALRARWMAGVIGFLSTYLGIGAVFPLKDARQPSSEKPRFFMFEWYELLRTHDAMRWNFANVIVSQIWQGLQAGLIIYYLNIVKLVPAKDAGTGYILTVLCGLFTQIIAAGLFGYIYGKVNPKGRELSRNPRNMQILGCALCAVCNFVAILVDQPTKRDEVGSYHGLLIAYALTRMLHSPYDYWWNSVRGWQIDEDCHKFGIGKKRREGVIVGLLNFGIAIGSTVSVIVISVVLVGNNPICDTRLAAKDMSEDCIYFVWYTYLLGLPIMKLVVLAIVFYHPIKGDRLKRLYKTQGRHHQVVDNDKAGDQGGEPEKSLELAPAY